MAMVVVPRCRRRRCEFVDGPASIRSSKVLDWQLDPIPGNGTPRTRAYRAPPPPNHPPSRRRPTLPVQMHFYSDLSNKYPCIQLLGDFAGGLFALGVSRQTHHAI